MTHITEIINEFAPRHDHDRKADWMARVQEIIGYCMFADDGRCVAYLPSVYGSASKVMALAIAKIMQPLRVLELHSDADMEEHIWRHGPSEALRHADVVLCHYNWPAQWGTIACSQRVPTLLAMWHGEPVVVDRPGKDKLHLVTMHARWMMLGSCESFDGALARRLVWLRLHNKATPPVLGMIRELDPVDSLPWIAEGWRRYQAQGGFSGDDECAVPA